MTTAPVADAHVPPDITHSHSCPVASTADRLEFETLISDTSRDLMATPFDGLPGAIETAVDRVRIFFEADRAALLTVNEGRHVVNVHAASHSPGVPPVEGDVNLAEMFPWTYQLVVVEGAPVVTRVASLPPEAAVDRANNELLGIRTALAVPIVGNGHVTHLIVVNAVHQERDWPLAYVPRLRVLGELIVAALQRHRAYQSLRDSEARLLEKSARLAAAVDVAELGFSERRLSDNQIFVDGRMRELLGLRSDDETRPDVAWLAAIDPAQRDAVGELSRQLRAGEVQRASVEYRYEHPQRGWIWLRHSAERSQDGPDGKGARIFTAIQDITDRREREERLKAAHEEEKRQRDRLQRENVYLQKEAARAHGGDLVAGRSPSVRHALELAVQVAATPSTVLLIGETGTGKERFAAYIHQASPRRGRHMVRVNCSAIPATLIEGELFGREKGAYTGALSRQIGRFELAQGSTLFLDEIGDMPLEVQVKLLRVLQERTIERLGSPTPISVDVRIIAATNRDLEAAVRQGTFRTDLYYRLNVFPIEVPPLRERLEDIPELVETLVEELAGVMRKRFTSVDRASVEALTHYHWPGNVRELRNILERAMILSPGPTLTVDVPRSTSVTAPLRRNAAASRELRHLEREHILLVLNDTGWRIRGKGGAAEALGLKPTTLESHMARLGIRRPGTDTPS